MNPSNKYSLPKKHLGQNFLTNARMQERILQESKLDKNETVLEIGIGRGVLTTKIAELVKEVIVIEKDIDLIRLVADEFRQKNITLIHDDVLAYPFEKLPDNLKIISNLPYNIATPIIEKVIKHRKKFTAFYMTVQLEHALRMTAKINTKEYGSLSCFVQYYTDVKKIFRIKNTAFYPSPKVQSCFLLMTFLKEPRVMAKDEDYLFSLIRTAFQQRRKTLQNTLSDHIPKNILKDFLSSMDIDINSRAENIPLDVYVQLSHKTFDNKIYKNNEKK